MNDNNDFIKEWMEGNVSPEELKKRKEAGDVFIRDLEETITKSSRLKVPEGLSHEDAWAKLSSKLTEAPAPEAKVVSINRWIPISIAASLTAILIAFLFLNTASEVTQMAETKIYILPDGSKVTMNADSKISYNKLRWSFGRQLKLEGEAFFEVKKGSTFTVETANGTVAVLGTSFNVQARPAQFEVSCFTGKVSVTRGDTEVILTKGNFTKLDGHVLTSATPFESGHATWRTGEFYFEQQPLTMVIDELERQFDVDIIYKGDESRLYSGYFSSKNLDEALKMVFLPMALKYERKEKTVVVQ